MDKNNSGKLLTFGHYISIVPSQRKDLFLISDGYTNKVVSLKYLNYTEDGSIYDRCIFRIYPAFSSTCIEKILHNFEEQENTSALNSNAMNKNMLQKHEQLEQRGLHQYKANLELFEKVKGQTITFQCRIQLLHVASN